MRAIRRLSTACLLVAGAGGAVAPLHAASYVDAHYRAIAAPDCVDARNMVAEFSMAPINATYLRVQHVGDPGTAELEGEVANVVTWDVGQLSGLSMPPSVRASTQRGWRDLGPPDPASAFQLGCNAAGFVLNSRQFAHADPLVLEGPSVGVARDLEPAAQVFGNATSALTIAANVSIPWVQQLPNPLAEGTAQGSFFYYARDTTSGIVFAHVIALFDNRAAGVNGAGAEAVSADAYTAFVESPLSARTSDGDHVQFVSISPLSAVEQFEAGWAAPRYFRAYVTYAQFRAMLARLRQGPLPTLSPRPEDYRVTSFGFLGEIFPGTTRAHEVALGASVTDLELSEAYYDVHSVHAIEYYHAGLDRYFVSTRQDDIAALDSGRFPGWTRTGESFLASPSWVSGTSPVCRFYLPPDSGDSHFFSASASECAEVARRFPQFVLEDPEVMFMGVPDVATGACPGASIPVYRLWNGRSSTNHRYTTSSATRSAMLAAGWIAEGYGPLGVAMCAPA